MSFADETSAARKLAGRPGWGVFPIEGKDTAKFLAAFNDAEPKTNYRADQILVSLTPDFAYVELFVGGCIDNDGRIAPKLFEQMMLVAFGGEIPGALAM